jgi:NAD(P)-dependent dehydrogenase (short-subunit alcohol dehydrogenase family)
MIAQGHGRIVMHSSVVGYTPLRWRAAYVATKHAIEGLTNTHARSNCAAPASMSRS